IAEEFSVPTVTKDISARLLHSSDGQGSCTLLVRRGVTTGHILPSTLRPRILGRIAVLLTKSRRAAHRFSTESSAPWCQGGGMPVRDGHGRHAAGGDCCVPVRAAPYLALPQVFRPAGSRIGCGTLLPLFVSAARGALQTRSTRVPGRRFPALKDIGKQRRGPGYVARLRTHGPAEGKPRCRSLARALSGPGHGTGLAPFLPGTRRRYWPGCAVRLRWVISPWSLKSALTSNPGPVRIRPFPSGVVCCWKPRSAA